MKGGDHLLGDGLGADVLGREQNDHVAEVLDAAAPEVRGAAGLHDDGGLGQLREGLEEPIAR